MAAEPPKPAAYGTRVSFRPGGGFTPAGELRALLDRAVAAHGAGRFDAAEALYRQVLTVAPADPDALANLGAVALQRGRVEEGVALLLRSLAVKPAQANALSNLGNVLVAQRRYAEAAVRLEAAVALAPDNADACNNLGNALAELGRAAEADAAFARALELKPGFTAARLSHASLHRNQGRHAEAMALYDQVLAAEPANPQAAFEKATLLILLAGGHDLAGWRLFESRWRKVGFEKSANAAHKPLWLGEGEVAGKTLLLHAEQGLGDTLQMLRYVPLVAARGARIVLVVPGQLVDLARAAPGADVVLAAGQPLPDYDLFCPLMSLPLATGALPAEVPYLTAPPAAARLGPRARRRIGLAWAGDEALAPLLDADADFVSLQVDRDAPGLSFADTAAVIAELDLVIAADTAVAHLAGALGRPVWILLPYAPDYRWGLRSERTAWYPTARLYRQPAPGDWPSVIRQLKADVVSG